MQNFKRWGLRPQTSGLRRLGVLPTDPQPPAAGGLAPRPPVQSAPLRISGYAPVVINELNRKKNLEYLLELVKSVLRPLML